MEFLLQHAYTIQVFAGEFKDMIFQLAFKSFFLCLCTLPSLYGSLTMPTKFFVQYFILFQSPDGFDIMLKLEDSFLMHCKSLTVASCPDRDNVIDCRLLNARELFRFFHRRSAESDNFTALDP